MTVDLHTFERLPIEDVAKLVVAQGPLVATFPINGTRRWYLLKVLAGQINSQNSSYLQIMEQRHIALYKLFFDHGVHTLLTPIFGPDLLERGDEYVQMAFQGILRLATEPLFLDFYDEYQIRVRFYGDYRRHLAGTPYEGIIDQLNLLTERTQTYKRNRLFFGMFANDPSEQIANISVSYYQQNHHIPDRKTLVEQYYGEYVDPVSFFIGFDKLSAFDMPLLATGEEDLYFTISPSLDLTPKQLRQILYDHLFTRRLPEPEYETLPSTDLIWMQKFYENNHERTLGLGELKGNIWFPIPGEVWPSETMLTKETSDEQF